jgi:hypothetical protein
MAVYFGSNISNDRLNVKQFLDGMKEEIEGL